MKPDVERANAALAGGRQEEASVYAWNALADLAADDAPELARIAQELDDPRLLREIERRGFSTRPAEQLEPEPVKRKPILRLARALPALAVALFIAGALVTSIPTESGERYPTGKDSASETRFVRPILAERSGVWLVPLGEPGSVDVDRLAQELAAHYRLPVAVLPDIALPRWTLDANERSLVAEQLILLLRQAYRAQDGAAIIGITDFEMYATEDRTHVFSWRAPPHYASSRPHRSPRTFSIACAGIPDMNARASSSPATSASSTTAVMRSTIRTVSFARRCMETATSTSSRRVCKTSPPRRSAPQATGVHSGSSSCGRRASCTISRAAALALKLSHQSRSRGTVAGSDTSPTTCVPHRLCRGSPVVAGHGRFGRRGKACSSR